MTARSRNGARRVRHSRAKSAPAARSASSATLSERRVAPRTRVVLVTGMSGAGRSSALKALEDLGYEAVDNLPISLLSRFVQPTAQAARERGAIAERPNAAKPRALAIGVDIRTRDFDVEPVLLEFDHLIDRRGLDVHLLFLDSSDDTLLRRYT